MKAFITTAILVTTTFTASAQERAAVGAGTDANQNAALEARLSVLETRMANAEREIEDLRDQLPPPNSMIATTYTGAVDGWSDCLNLAGRTLIGTGTYNDPVLGALSYSLGDTGGAAAVQLTIEQMPRHRHATVHASSSRGRGNTENGWWSGWTAAEANTGLSSAEGNDQPHENRMPFQAVRFLCKN